MVAIIDHPGTSSSNQKSSLVCHQARPWGSILLIRLVISQPMYSAVGVDERETVKVAWEV